MLALKKSALFFFFLERPLFSSSLFTWRFEFSLQIVNAHSANKMSGRGSNTKNFRPGHFPLVVQAIAHVQDTLSDDVTTEELQNARAEAFQTLQIDAMRRGDDFVNEEFKSSPVTYPNGNAANNFPNQKYDTALYMENPRTGKSIHDKYVQLQAQGLQINKSALSIYPKASKNEFPSGDNNPETRKAKVLFSCMHSKDPVDVPEDQKVAFNPEIDTLENLLGRLQADEKYANFVIGTGNAANIKLKDGFPVWLKFGPWGSEQTMYADWSVSTKQQRMVSMKKDTAATPTLKQGGDSKAPPTRVSTVDKMATANQQRKEMLELDHANKLEEINAKASAEKSVIEAQTKKRRASFGNQERERMTGLYRDARDKLAAAQQSKVQVLLNSGVSKEDKDMAIAVLNEGINELQDEVNRLDQIIYSNDVKENTPEPPSSEPPSSKKSRGEDSDDWKGFFERMDTKDL